MIVQSDAYAGTVSALVVAEVTKNLTMADDPACLFIDANTAEGRATGLVRDSGVSCLVLVTVYADAVPEVLGALSPTMIQKLDDCLKAGWGSRDDCRTMKKRADCPPWRMRRTTSGGCFWSSRSPPQDVIGRSRTAVESGYSARRSRHHKSAFGRFTQRGRTSAGGGRRSSPGG